MTPRTGRPKTDNPKNVRLELRLTKGTAKKLQDCADTLGTSRTEVITQGIDLVEERLKKG
jgi:hypothetical protein